MRSWTWVLLALTTGCGIFDQKDDSGDDTGQDAGLPGPFRVSANVTNVPGPGLVLDFKSSTTVTREVSADGVVEFGEFAKGTMFDIVPTGQPTTRTCHAASPTGTLNADVTIEVVCADFDLLITEVGPVYAGGWFELRNDATAPRNLSDYRLRTSAGVDAALPALTVPAGGHAIVKVGGLEVYAGQNVVLVPFDPTLAPWASGGFLAITKNGVNIDSVLFGGATNPTPTIGWGGGGSAVAIAGASLQRVRGGFDTDRKADWVDLAFMTPGGVNDITNETDADNDGIPDQAEVSGGTYAGLDLFAMGARTNKRDIFLEIDRMTSPTSDVGMVPRRPALDKALAVFAPKNIALHIDVGTLYSGTFSPADYNLGGGNIVPYAQVISFTGTSSVKSVFEYKAQHSDIRRWPVFHYVLWGDREDEGSAGRAERLGNDITITIGGNHTAENTFLINDQALVLVHELGHNLGLAHGGDAEKNYKPNYFSIMNYLYRQGLSTVGNAEGDRYLLFKGNCGITQSNQLTNNLGTATPIITFSDGSGAQINEASVTETGGIGRTGSMAVDYNCSGGTNNGYTLDLNNDGLTEVISDYDDWTNMTLSFGNSFGGQSFAPRKRFDLVDDRGEVVNEQM